MNFFIKFFSNNFTFKYFYFSLLLLSSFVIFNIYYSRFPGFLISFYAIHLVFESAFVFAFFFAFVFAFPFIYVFEFYS